MGHYSEFYEADERAALLRQAGLYEEYHAADADDMEEIYWKARALVAEQQLSDIRRNLRAIARFEQS